MYIYITPATTLSSLNFGSLVYKKNEKKNTHIRIYILRQQPHCSSNLGFAYTFFFLKNTHTHTHITPATTLQLQFSGFSYTFFLKKKHTHTHTRYSSHHIAAPIWVSHIQKKFEKYTHTSHTYYASHRIALFLNLGSLIYSVYIEKSHKKKHTKTKIAHKRTTTAFYTRKRKKKKNQCVRAHELHAWRQQP